MADTNALAPDTPPAQSPGSTNALMSGAPQAAPQGPAQAPIPPPTHQETIAALRHFDAVRKELGRLMADPGLGKSNMKSKIIASVSRLVAGQFLTPAQAVDELSKVPTEPLQQMQWAKGQYSQAKMAENGILDHYGATQPHLGTVADHFAATKDMADPDNHADHVASLMANFKPAAANA